MKNVYPIKYEYTTCNEQETSHNWLHPLAIISLYEYYMYMHVYFVPLYP